MYITKISNRLFLVSFVVLLLIGCDKIQIAPLVIDADGKQYIACEGLVWVSDDSSMFSDKPVYKVSFSDLAGKNHTLRGVQNLHVQQPYDDVAPMPYYLPDIQKNADVNGKAYIEGNIYTWENGAKAKLVNAKWAPAKLSSPCK